VPLFYGFGPYLLFFPAMILLWIYQSPTERALSVAFTVLLGATPWMLRLTDRLSEAGTGVPQALYRLARDPADPRAVEQVEAAVATSPQDWEARVVLALAQKRQSQLGPAERLLGEAQALVGGNAEAEGIVANNLGNVMFAMGRLQSAEQAYQRAVAALPSAAEPVFNLHRLYQRQTRLEESKEQMAKASGLSPERVATWNEDAEPNLNRYVVDLELPADQLTRRAFADLFSPTPLAARLWQVAAGPVPEMAAPLFAALALLLFGVLRALQSRMRVTRPCSRCADPAPVRLADEGESGRLCEPCTNLFVRNMPVDRRVRFQKEVEIGRTQLALRWGTRAAGLALPGLAGFMRGRPLRGALLLALALLVALRLLLPHGLLLEPAPAPTLSASQTYALLGALGVLWLVSLVRAFHLSRGEA
jgi:tetratricopeptide (TPR) repeat protein